MIEKNASTWAGIECRDGWRDNATTFCPWKRKTEEVLNIGLIHGRMKTLLTLRVCVPPAVVLERNEAISVDGVAGAADAGAVDQEDPHAHDVVAFFQLLVRGFAHGLELTQDPHVRGHRIKRPRHKRDVLVDGNDEAVCVGRHQREAGSERMSASVGSWDRGESRGAGSRHGDRTQRGAPGWNGSTYTR